MWGEAAVGSRPTRAGIAKADPIQRLITPGQARDLAGAEPLLAAVDRGVIVIADASKALSRTRAPGQRCEFGSGGPADRANALLVFER